MAVSPSFQINWAREMVCRIKPSERVKIQGHIDRLREVDSVVGKILAAMDGLAWEKSPFLTHKNMPYYALIAHQMGRLLDARFATLINFWAFVQHHGKEKIKTCSLREEVLLASSLDLISDKSAVMRVAAPAFVSEMERAPVSEQRFFIVPYAKNDSAMVEYLGWIIVPFLRAKCAQGEVRMMPSFTMRQVFLNMRFGAERATSLNPVLGISLKSHMIANGMTNSHDCALHFPEVRLPSKADGGYQTPWGDFTDHDFYHSVTTSSIPLTHQQVSMGIAHICDDLSKEVQKASGLPFPSRIWNVISNYTNSFASMNRWFIDLEHIVYRVLDRKLPNQVVTADTLFWYNFCFRLSRAKLEPQEESRVIANVCRYIHSLPRGSGLHLEPDSQFKGLLAFNLFYARSVGYRVLLGIERFSNIARIWEEQRPIRTTLWDGAVIHHLWIVTLP